MIRDFWININEKYQRNKAVIWFIVAVVVLFLLVMHNMNQVLKTTRGSSNKTTTSVSASNDQKISEIVSKSEDSYENVKENMKDVSISRVDLIKLFVQLCNSGKTEAAYDFLSDTCKNELYPTKQKFIDGYYSVIFKISKNCDVTEVKNDTYRVKYTNDSLSTGGKADGGDGIVDYITYDENGKISISGFVKSEEPKITSIAPYFTVYVDKTTVYTDHISYSIRVKNNTKADIYINDADNSNLYIKDESNDTIGVDLSDMYESDYLVSAGAEKKIELTFNCNYFDKNDMSEMCFANIVIKNKEYLDSTSEYVNKQTGEKQYEKVKTNYPEKYSWTVKL